MSTQLPDHPPTNSLTAIQTRLNVIKEQVTAHLSTISPDVSLREPAAAMRILAVSKTHPPSLIREAYQVGQMDFGENYVQEAVAKIAELKDLPLCWHFIGHLQSNKARIVAENFDWVQSVDSLKLARKLSSYSSPDKPLNITVQINISNEEGKSGIAPDIALDFCKELLPLPNIKLRGLMAIPEATDDPVQQKEYFRAMRQLFQSIYAFLNASPDTSIHSKDWDTLSMGMSQDMLAALDEGSNMLRIGTAIFGKRLAV